MNPAGFLKELANQVRRDTLGLLESAPAELLPWCPPGTRNHLLWHAGHALWLQDHFGVHPLAGMSELPAGWDQLFASGCDPTDPPHPWPEKQTLHQMLNSQHHRIHELLTAAEQDRWPDSLATPEARSRFTTQLIHGLHDEARHQGEMYLILKWTRHTEPQP
jgi:hypothetical protein